MGFRFLLFIFQLHFSQSQQSQWSRSISYCTSSQPCVQLCPPSPIIQNNAFSDTSPQSLRSTVYCILGRCYCPESQILSKLCKPPDVKDTLTCTIPNANSRQGMPSIGIPASSGKQVLSICRVKGRRKCNGQRRKCRCYCVFSIMTKTQGQGSSSIPIPGLPVIIPGISQVPVSVPGQGGLPSSVVNSEVPVPTPPAQSD